MRYSCRGSTNCSSIEWIADLSAALNPCTAVVSTVIFWIILFNLQLTLYYPKLGILSDHSSTLLLFNFLSNWATELASRTFFTGPSQCRALPEIILKLSICHRSFQTCCSLQLPNYKSKKLSGGNRSENLIMIYNCWWCCRRCSLHSRPKINLEVSIYPIIGH